MVRRTLVAMAAALLAACGAQEDRIVEQRLFAMGTWVDIRLGAAEPDAARDALGEIEDMLRSYERDYYAWGDGELARLNAGLRDGRTVEVSTELAELLRDARRLSEQSGGVFDPGVGALVELWGFHADPAAVAGPPDPARIDAWLAAGASIADLTISDSGVSTSAGGLLLDLGGIAKGDAVDRMIRILRRRGIENAIVNAGGDLRALGTRGGRAWRIGIQSPRGAGILAVVELGDGESAFTSGDYERYFEYEDERLHHILDPTTGYPADHTQAITVIAADGVTADAAATALFVAGPARWRDVARAMGVRLALRVDASGRIEATGEMRDRLDLPDGPGTDIIVVGSEGKSP
ncbi:FAD:protein FMN transferase [Candidatus Rariloculus sp.]|uniref:FAD:protein FMN transferase n=1 Tax=Candidatus Rariloculus sp. TaxID=3101265 RepID=UPI003D09E8FA